MTRWWPTTAENDTKRGQDDATRERIRVHDYVELRTDPHSAHQLVLRYCAGARTVLDVGCTAGSLGRQLADQGATVDGIENDETAARQARRWYRRVLVGDVESMQLDLEQGSYAAIVCADIIEHLRDPCALLMRLRSLLAPDGRLVVSTPNIANWSMRLLHLAGRWDYKERGIMDRTHLRFFTRRTLAALLAEAGYRIVTHDVTVPLPAMRREPFSRWAHWLGRRWQNLLAYQFVVVATPHRPG
jgi:2-polyprenyl-3-methyl-5-hydroxy-6-metoxy-1,4-benzoquinol methylase